MQKRVSTRHKCSTPHTLTRGKRMKNSFCTRECLLWEIPVLRGKLTVGRVTGIKDGHRQWSTKCLQLAGKMVLPSTVFSITTILENTCSFKFFNKKSCHKMGESQKCNSGGNAYFSLFLTNIDSYFPSNLLW